jgi:ankyrin repeat protein
MERCVSIFKLKNYFKKYVNYNRSPLHLAVAANNMDVVQHLLNEGAKLQMFDRDSRSCLIIVRVFGFYLPFARLTFMDG